MDSKWYLGAGFAALGILVGSVAGLSSAELTTTLLGLLFAFIGGSVIAFLQKLDDDSRKAAGVALSAFSITATLGIYIGVTIRVNDALNFRQETSVSNVLQQDYLKGDESQVSEFLQNQVILGELELVEACRELQSNADTP